MTKQGKWNPRYTAYARAHGAKTQSEMLERDRLKYPGGVMCGFVLWNNSKINEARVAHPEWFYLGSLVEHLKYDLWLAQQTNGDTA